jgi:hypothetical protein
MPQQIILRKGTALEWTAAGTVVLAAGEPGFETNTGRFKIGNGTTPWTSLSYAVGTIPVNLADLADVTSDAPSSGQVLKWNGSAWAPAADSTGGGTGATYGISAETATGGTNLRLTGSDASTDDVKFASGTGISVSRVDGNTIDISNSITELDDLTGVDTSGSTESQALSYDVGTSQWIPKSVLNTVIADGVTLSADTSSTVTLLSGDGIALTGDAISNTVTIENDRYAFESVALPNLDEISTSFTKRQLQVGSAFGNIEFSADIAGVNNGLKIDVVTGPEFRGPVSAGGTPKQGTFYGATLQNNTADITLQPGGDLTPNGRVNIGSVVSEKDGSLMITRNTYSTVYGQGFWFNQHHATADAVNFNFLRTRGTGQTPTAVQSGDDIIDILFWGRDATANRAAAGISAVVTGTPAGGQVPGRLDFSTSNGTAYAVRYQMSETGVFKSNSISAYDTDANLALSGNGTGIVTLPAGTTVGGVAIGSLVIKGTVADNTALLALTGMTLGDTYVVLSPTPTHLWSYNASSTWVDLGEFQGPTGQGVPISGTIGQVLTKNSSTNYDTSWTSLATVATSGDYADLSGTPTLATVATSGAYADLSGTPSIPAAYASTSIDALSDVDTTTSAPTNGQTLVWNSAGSKWLPGTASAGDMVGPASATDNALVRFDGTTGKLSQTSLVTVSDTGAITAPGVGSVIPFYFADQTAFPSATTYHGAIAHSHADGKMYFAHNTTWNALANASDVPAAYSATSINALSDVDTVTAAPTNGQALVWNSVRSNWEPGTVAGGGGVTYGISAETNAGGADIRLTGSDASTDNLTIAAGTNVTVTRTDANTITIASSGGGGSMATRGDVAGTTTYLADAATGNVAVTGHKSYALLKILVDQPAWVRIYTDTASRSADSSRAEGVDPTPGSGVIAEVITTSAAQTVLISPGTIGFNNEGTPLASIPIAVTNKSGTTRTITVTLTVLQLEA